MNSKFRSAAKSALRGEAVRVVTNDGQVFGGWLEYFAPDERHALLRDATLLQDGGSIERGTVFVSHADSVEAVNSPGDIQRIPLTQIHTAPYHAREFDLEDNRTYVDEVRREGWADSYPRVRPIQLDEEEYAVEIVAGHKRLWAAAQAGLADHPVEVVDLDAWSAAEEFIYDHIPAERHLQFDEEVDRSDNWYSDIAIEEAIQALVERFNEEIIEEVDRLAFNAERLDVATLAPEVDDD